MIDAALAPILQAHEVPYRGDGLVRCLRCDRLKRLRKTKPRLKSCGAPGCSLGDPDFTYPFTHLWKVWCVFCRRWHWHAAGPGHRAAHCTEPSLYTATGYILVLAPDGAARGKAA